MDRIESVCIDPTYDGSKILTHINSFVLESFQTRTDYGCIKLTYWAGLIFDTSVYFLEEKGI
jgi:hypothetical protein